MKIDELKLTEARRLLYIHNMLSDAENRRVRKRIERLFMEEFSGIPVRDKNGVVALGGGFDD